MDLIDDVPSPRSSYRPDEARVRGGEEEMTVNHHEVARIQAEHEARLAELVVGLGANVQADQVVSITLEAGSESLMYRVAEAAYARGARYVDPWTFYPQVKRARMELAPEASLGFVPPWLGARLLGVAELHGALIRLSGPSAGRLFDGVDAGRLGLDLLPRMRESAAMIASGWVNWCVAPSPTPGWASLVYPSMDGERALERLWEDIAFVCRLDAEDPVAAWQARFTEMGRVAEALTSLGIDALRFSGPGTSLEVGLLPSSVWLTAFKHRNDGLRYVPNLPTEEVFTGPDPERVNGVVRATKPLVVSGGIVEGLTVRFEEGRAVTVDAARGRELVVRMIERDAGAARLGEVALVDGASRIGQTGKVFYDTLLDENAASHIALGHAYVDSVAGEGDLARLNDSAIHIDFMIGSPEVDVDAVLRDGSVIPVLRAGVWQI